MYLLFIEPVSPRYIHINSKTNQVHLLVPVVGGQEISTDNTCKATVALKEFFDGGALTELTVYKDALTYDIALLEEGNSLRVAKEARFVQIEAYIEAVQAMRYSYGGVIRELLKKPTNLYSIQLRPNIQDSQSQVVHPAFNIQRTNDNQGNPLSLLYQAMYKAFPGIKIAVPDPRTSLTRTALSLLPAPPGFEAIQRVLREQCAAWLGLSIDFTKRTDNTAVIKEEIDTLMGFGADATPQNYIDALLGVCAPNVWEGIPVSPFYGIPAQTSDEERTERLSILTQFFLAHVTIYCRTKGMSTQNFGPIIDNSLNLSNELTCIVLTALSEGEGFDVEECICHFFNTHARKFGLLRRLSAEDITAIKQKFERTYRTVTATEENPHMDDFLILDREATGETAKCVTHQGSICVNFAEIVDSVAASANPDYFKQIRKDFAIHPIEIPHKNEWVAGGVDLEPEALLARINDEQFQKLPQAVKEECCAHPAVQIRQFLHAVAKGKRKEAEALLNKTREQTLLRTVGIFTDYSSRTFNCTAYEYAYWAKDTHMCRMLGDYMEEETKAQMLARIDEMERIDVATGKPVGLKYQQNGQTYCSAHFDFAPLKQALRHYIDRYILRGAYKFSVIDAAWIVVGKAQRDLPAHVAQEYCRPNRSFHPTPEFNEETLPEDLTFYNHRKKSNDLWFPLASSNSGLGFDFALLHGHWPLRGRRLVMGTADSPSTLDMVMLDLEAVTRLDEVRTDELTQSRKQLKPLAIHLPLEQDSSPQWNQT
jgi:SidC N-terminal domain